MNDNGKNSLTELLVSQDTAVYIWYVDEDRIEWEGDTKGLFGTTDKASYPSFKEFNKIINPQEQTERMFLFTKMIEDFEKQEVLGKLSSISFNFRLQNILGETILVDEHATLHRYTLTGQKLVCGTLLIRKQIEESLGADYQVTAISGIESGSVNDAQINEALAKTA
jgi:hypothetical protein